MPDSIYFETVRIREAKATLGEGDPIDVSSDLIRWIQDTLAAIAEQAETTPAGGSKDYAPLNQILYEAVRGD